MKSNYFYRASGFALVFWITCASSLPFAYFHGISSSCERERIGWEYFLNHTNSPGLCIEIGNGFNDSRALTMWKQAEIACQQITSNPLFANGLNLIGISQGGLLARTVLQTCDALPPVNNLISVGSPQAGIASVPHCGNKIFALPCRLKVFPAHFVYWQPGYDNSSAAGYVKAPSALLGYYLHNGFLTRINNELPWARNQTYKERVKKLNLMVLIKVCLM